MRFRRTLRFHNLKRPKLRQTWNKYNLYNLWRYTAYISPHRTFFQQKWTAKASLRAYHGEHIREHEWERMFSRRLLSVVNMNPKYMAKFDGSEQAAGRGSGRDEPTREDVLELGSAIHDVPTPPTNASRSKFGSPLKTPYMQMVFAPQERRLDIAVFRAMFASSARQARQFCVHGAVKVNGKLMTHPGYLLNPGDMFQVDPERVLYATGAPKQPEPKEEGEEEADGEVEAAPEATEEASESAGKEASEAADPPEADEVADSTPAELEAEQLKKLLREAKTLLSQEADDLSVKQKQELRRLARETRSAVSRLGAQKDSAPEPAKSSTGGSLVGDLTSLLAKLDVKSSSSPAAPDQAAAEQQPASPDDLTPVELERFEQLLRQEEENPYDPSKPYATPWRPRPFMSPFAFIPRYLEVNQNICAAVYLRHPVARVGESEVPTPFPVEMGQLAFNWYLRRR